MPMLQAIRAHADYSGDSRVDPFLAKYFAYLAGQPTGVFSEGWGAQRWGDMIDVLYWFYNRTGDASLLNLVRRIHANSANYVNNLPTLHNVNLAQGFREPAQYWVLSGTASDRAATYADYATIQSTYGQFPGGGFAGDENARPGFGDPRQGFETCGIVEYMLSHEILTRITGDPLWSDRAEELAFNSLPAALDPAGRAVHYITSANSIDLDNVAKTVGQFQNGFAMQSYRAGVDQYRCCPHNYGMGWPYFVEEMWLGTWAGGDTVTLRLPMSPVVKAWPAQHNAVSVHYGALAFSLRITENWTQTGGSAQFPEYDVHAGSPWNYGLVPGAPVTVSTGGAVNDPFTVANAPIRLTTGAQRIDAWQADSQHVVTPLQDGPVASAAPVETVTLIPMGAARLRITSFPQTGGPKQWLAPGVPFRIQNRNSGKVLGVDGMSTANSANVVQFDDNGTADHLWRIVDAGGGNVKVQNVNSGKLLAVNNMSTADSANVEQFADNGTADHRWRLTT